MTQTTPVTLGTRGSRLALAQTETCIEKLREAGIQSEIRVIKTTSEHNPETPLAVLDQRDVFTRQLDEALLRSEIDIAIHSLKDVPTDLPEGITLAAITERHDPRDALVSEAGFLVDDLPEGAVVATSSLRRRAQLLYHRPDLQITGIRGNVDTRIRKVREGAADALVLARAGLERLGLDAPRTVIEPEVMLPAVGQGALAAATLEDHPLRDRVRRGPEPHAERESYTGRAGHAPNPRRRLPGAGGRSGTFGERSGSEAAGDRGLAGWRACVPGRGCR